MRPDSDVHRVFELWGQGLEKIEICRVTGLPWSTVQKWIVAGRDPVLSSPMRMGRTSVAECPDGGCALRTAMPEETYAYLLGLYLGDGHIVRIRSTWKLSVFCCDDWPGIQGEAAAAIQAIVPNNVVRSQQRKGMHEVSAMSNHWLHLFPQHGPGKKHERPIVLDAWQREIAIDAYPGRLVRGLVHADGSVTVNRIKWKSGGGYYEYRRYMFSNRSADIHGIFIEACERLGARVRWCTPRSLSVADRQSVQILDQFVGPKY